MTRHRSSPSRKQRSLPDVANCSNRRLASVSTRTQKVLPGVLQADDEPAVLFSFVVKLLGEPATLVSGSPCAGPSRGGERHRPPASDES